MRWFVVSRVSGGGAGARWSFLGGGVGGLSVGGGRKKRKGQKKRPPTPGWRSRAPPLLGRKHFPLQQEPPARYWLMADRGVKQVRGFAREGGGRIQRSRFLPRLLPPPLPLSPSPGSCSAAPRKLRPIQSPPHDPSL